MSAIIEFIVKIVMVNFMYSRYIHTGVLPDNLERERYL